MSATSDTTALFFCALAINNDRVQLEVTVNAVAVTERPTRSEIIEGRTYTTQSGQTRVLKEAEIVLVAQEGERAMAVLSMVSGGKTWQVPVTENGGVVFSTKHTVADEDGNGTKKSAHSSALSNESCY